MDAVTTVTGEAERLVGRDPVLAGEQQLRGTVAIQKRLAQFMVGGLDDAWRDLTQGRLAIVLAPGPIVAEPESR